MKRKRIAVLVGLTAALVTGVVAASASTTPSHLGPRPVTQKDLYATGASTAPNAVRAPNAVHPNVLATNAHCGQVVIASLVLNGDLNCANDGLTVAKASVILNLNGHTIYGSGTSAGGTGVWVQASSVTVENGTVNGFAVGVDVGVDGPVPAAVKITKVTTTLDSLGIDDAGSKTVITSSPAIHDVAIGIACDTCTGSTYTSNSETSTGGSVIGGWGMEIYGTGVKVTGNRGDSNWIGLYVDAGSTATIIDSEANWNVFDGFVNASTTNVDGGGNTAKGNDFGSGNAPEQCFGMPCG